MRRATMALAAFGVVVMCGAGVARGHGGEGTPPNDFQKENVYWFDPNARGWHPLQFQACTFGMHRLEHGAYGSGFVEARSKALTTALGPSPNPCTAPFDRNPGDLRVQYLWMKRRCADCTPRWKLCRASDWRVNKTEEYNLHVARTFPDPPPCGNGYYKAIGKHRIWMQGAWRAYTGTPTDKHYLNGQG
jgi:hypothetical protein